MSQTNGLIKKVHFWLFWGTFDPKSPKQEFSRICVQLFWKDNHLFFTFVPFLAKTNDSILKKSPKSPFLGYFRHFWAKMTKMRIFPKNRAPSLFLLYWPLTSCKKPEKTNDPILRTLIGQTDRLTDWQTDWRRSFHRTLPFGCPIIKMKDSLKLNVTLR